MWSFSAYGILLVVILAIQDTLLANGVSVQGQNQKMGFRKSGHQHKIFTSHAFERQNWTRTDLSGI